MKKTVFALLFILCISAFPQNQEAMKAYEEYMTPGKEHSALAAMTGEWKTTVKNYIPGMPNPLVTEGVSKMEMILGGRYLKSDFSAQFMGQQMNGIDIVGFDNASRKFTSVWIDNMGTGTMVETGTYNAETKRIEYTGSMTDPVSKKEQATVSFLERVSADKCVQKMFTRSEGKDTLVMEITYERKK
ncbi:MAG: DUF1579 domain-containing protein [Ignavibacteria bacterium]|nr:DUF1579 domain-containing protein [Ignavibacteria bacterium]